MFGKVSNYKKVVIHLKYEVYFFIIFDYVQYVPPSMVPYRSLIVVPYEFSEKNVRRRTKDKSFLRLGSQPTFVVFCLLCAIIIALATRRLLFDLTSEEKLSNGSRITT